MKTPPSLKQGDKIGIVSTARKITLPEIQPALDTLRAWGLIPVLGNNLFKEDNQFAGTDAERAADMQAMMDNPEIKAIIFARGGYGTVRVIDKLDFTKFLQAPKWVAGYSDITVFHSHITNLGVEAIHSVMLSGFPADGSVDNATKTLQAALFGNKLSYDFKIDAFSHLQKTGNVTAPLTGGNLSLLYALNNSVSDIDTDGKILFLEDLDEYLYHIDRMMINLKRSGKLKNLTGLLIGGMTEMKDNAVPFGKTPEEIIADAVAEYDYPVCYGFPAGHIVNNLALIMGRMVNLQVKADGGVLAFQ